MENKTFKLEDLNAEFWSKVILINIWPSSGVGGSGSLWIVTSDEKQYYILRKIRNDFTIWSQWQNGAT